MDKLIFELKDLLQVDNLGASTLVHSMRNIRILIERNNLQSEYQILNLYCNWILHDSISASVTAFRILEDLTDSMISHNDDSADKSITDAVIEGLKIHILQTELLSFVEKFDFKLDMIRDYSYWRTFGNVLIRVLMDRPLRFSENPKKKEKEIYDRIVTKVKKSGYKCNGVIAVKFEEIEGNIYWSILTFATKSKNVKIVGKMQIITQEMVDNYR